MLDEREAAETIREAVENHIGRKAHEGDRAFAEASTEGLPESETSFIFILSDGTKFLTTTTKIEEGA